MREGYYADELAKRLLEDDVRKMCYIDVARLLARELLRRREVIEQVRSILRKAEVDG